jgi:septum formation protein
MSVLQPDIYLASASPRRRELLEQIGIRFHVVRVAVDESLRPGEAPEVYVERLALAKARAGRAAIGGGAPHPVLGADTAVVVDDMILGKPADRPDGLAMLSRLSGRCHWVFSAVAVVDDRSEAVRLNVNVVTFRTTTAEEREAYWATGESLDKAGGYGIQGHGAIFIEHLAGSYSGVMGLPLYETAELLRGFGIAVL